MTPLAAQPHTAAHSHATEEADIQKPSHHDVFNVNSTIAEL